MEKEKFEKSHVGERRERRPNGDIYIFERITTYDKTKKRSVTISQKLKGKLLAGTTEMIATRAKCKKLTTPEITRKHTGLTDILDWIGKASGIDNDLSLAFSDGEAAKIISIARYWLATNGNTLPRIESWQIMHELPYMQGISKDVYSDLFKAVGVNENSIQQYFSKRASRLGKSPVLAYDSTTSSTYSENQTEARQGFNKDHDGLNTIKLLTLYSVKDKEPIAFAKQPGNIPDVISIENTLSQLQFLGIEKPLIVTDNGYYSQSNMCEFAKRNMKFLTLVDSDIKWVRSAIDQAKNTIGNLQNNCPFDHNIFGTTVSIKHEFSQERKYSTSKGKAGEKEVFQRKLYVHVFYSANNYARQEANFCEDLLALKVQLENGITDFSKSAQKKIDKYLTLSRVGRGGKLKISFNDEKIAEAKKYFGYFALVGNQTAETFTALEDYRLREKIEELFKEQKNRFDGTRPRVWYPDSLRGRQFVQFIGLGYCCFLTKKIKEIKDNLGKDKEEKSQKLIALEENLKKWLDQHSIAQILDWFDCIETTSIQTSMGAMRWSTEAIARDKLFLSLLGVTK